MIFITNQNTLVNISRTMYTRDSSFYEAVHIALFKTLLVIPNFTTTITQTIDNYCPPLPP